MCCGKPIHVLASDYFRDTLTAKTLTATTTTTSTTTSTTTTTTTITTTSTTTSTTTTTTTSTTTSSTTTTTTTTTTTPPYLLRLSSLPFMPSCRPFMVRTSVSTLETSSCLTFISSSFTEATCKCTLASAFLF